MTLPLGSATLDGLVLLALVVAVAPLWSGLIDAVAARLAGFRGASIRRPYGELVATLTRRADGAAVGGLPTLALAAAIAATGQLTAHLARTSTATVTTAFVIPFVALSLLARILLALAAMRGAPARRATTLARELLLIATVEPTLLVALLTAVLAPIDGTPQPMTDAALAVSAIAFALAAWTTGGTRPPWEPTVALSPANPTSGLVDATAGVNRFPLELSLYVRRLTLWIVWVTVFLPIGGSSPPGTASPGSAAVVLIVKLLAVALAIALAEGRLVQRGLLRTLQIPAVALALAIAGLTLAMFGRVSA